MIARLAIAVVTFSTPLVLARILVPASYGTFKLAWLWCTTLGVVLPMGLTPSLIYFVPREPERRRYFISHALLVTTSLGVCAGTLLYLFGPGIALRMHKPELADRMCWVALFSALFLGGSTMDSIPMSQGRIKLAAALRFGYEVTQAIGIVAGALITRSLTGALAGIVAGTGFRAVACWVMVLREHGLHVSREDLKRQLAYGLRGAMGGWVAAEAATRGILLLRAGHLLGGMRYLLPWRTLSMQALAAAVAAPVGAVVLRLAQGPVLLRLVLCGAATGLAYLAALRATGELPPVREWIPRKRPAVPGPTSLAA